MGQVCGTASGRDVPVTAPTTLAGGEPPLWPATTTDKRVAGPVGKAGAADTMGIPGGGKQVLLKKRPVGDFKDDDFEVVETAVPEPGDGEVVIKNIYISIDPTHRIWATDADQYMPAIGLGTVMRALAIGKVVKSSDPAKLAVGAHVTTVGGVQEYTVSPIAAAIPVVPGVPLSQNHSLFSVVIGVTAWAGTNICEAKAGKTIVISGAAGAVGSIAGQVAKSRGAKVIGIAGSADKCAWLKNELGFDEAINYKTEKIDERLDQLCPDGVDGYFDNVGGTVLETMLKKMKNFSSIAFCGSISGYNGGDETQTMTVKNYDMILMRRIKVQGFVCTDHLGDIGPAMAELGGLVQQGKMKVHEDIREVGIEEYPRIVRLLYRGENTGKLMMKLPE